MALYEELEIDQGSDFKYRVDLTAPNGSAFDLAGWSITGDIKRNYKSETATASFVTTNPQPGRILLSMDDSDTSNLLAGRYVYDVYIESSTGDRYRVLEGILTVTPSVTS